METLDSGAPWPGLSHGSSLSSLHDLEEMTLLLDYVSLSVKQGQSSYLLPDPWC